MEVSPVYNHTMWTPGDPEIVRMAFYPLKKSLLYITGFAFQPDIFHLFFLNISSVH